MANNWEFAVRVAIQRRKQIKSDEGSTAGWINSVTKEEIRGIIATHQTTIENYNSKIKQIWKYEPVRIDQAKYQQRPRSP